MSDDVEVPVDDLEVVTLTRAELEQRLQRERNAAWKEARVSFAAKSERRAELRAELAEAVARITKLEQLMESALGVLIPGLGAPVSSTKKETHEHGT